VKKLKIILFSLALAATSTSFIACGSNAAEDTQGKEYTSAYVCPMHCTGSGATEMGTCPVCKMDYVKLDKHESDGHKH